MGEWTIEWPSTLRVDFIDILPILEQLLINSYGFLIIIDGGQSIVRISLNQQKEGGF